MIGRRGYRFCTMPATVIERLHTADAEASIKLLFGLTIRRQYALIPTPDHWQATLGRSGSVNGRNTMVGPISSKTSNSGATRRAAVGLILGAPLLSACAGVQSALTGGSQPAGAPQQPQAVGTGQVK